MTTAAVFATQNPHAWLVYCDGSAVPNPGRMGLGAVLTSPGGGQTHLSQTSSERGCNNEAELRALMLALREANSLGATALLVYSDSRVLVDQLGGGAAAQPIARLAGLFDEARALLGLFDRLHLAWIPRHRNGAADELARAALGKAPKVTG